MAATAFVVLTEEPVVADDPLFEVAPHDGCEYRKGNGVIDLSVRKVVLSIRDMEQIVYKIVATHDEIRNFYRVGIGEVLLEKGMWPAVAEFLGVQYVDGDFEVYREPCSGSVCATWTGTSHIFK